MYVIPYPNHVDELELILYLLVAVPIHLNCFYMY